VEFALTQQRLKELFEYHPDGFLIERTGRKHLKVVYRNYGHKGKKGYHQIKIDWRMFKFASIIYLFHHGVLVKGLDHIDRNTSNNRIENLRQATASQNSANRKIKNTNTSGFVGVSFQRKNKKWRAKAGVIYLGLFHSREAAARAYDKKAFELYGEFAHLNFPDGLRASSDS
jgi:hypothetical protein